MQEIKQKQAHAYNRNAKHLSPLKWGDAVRIQPVKAKEWEIATVAKVLPYQSYEVRTPDERQYRRNRRHPRKSKEPIPKPTRITEMEDPDLSPRPRPLTNQRSTTRVEQDPRPRPSKSANQRYITPAEQNKSKVDITSKEPERESSTYVKEKQPGLTRSGRLIKTPLYLKDYIT